MDERIGIDGIENVEKKRIPDVRNVLREAAYVAVAAVLGRAEIIFGALPFGFASLSATGMHAVSVLLGLCISLVGRQDIFVYVTAYALTLALRAVISMLTGDGRNLFCEHISFRVITCATGAFGVGLYRLLKSGFLYYDLFGAIISILVCAVAVALLYSLENPRAGIVARLLGGAVLLGAMTWGLRGVSFYGVSLSAFFAMLASLWVTRKKGLSQGTFIALVTGLCVSVGYAPLFAFGVAAYSLLSAVTPFFGALSSFGIGLAWGIYMDGISALSSLLPALLASNFLFLTVDRLYLTEKIRAGTHTSEEKQALKVTVFNDVSMARLDDTASRIKRLCEGLSSLSDMLIKTDVAEAQELLAYEIGELGIENDRDLKMAYCGGYMADSIRSAALAAQLRAVSEYLAGIMVENEQSFCVDASLGERISAELSEVLKDVSFAVTVLGEMKKRIIVYSQSVSTLERYREDIRRAVSGVCGFCVDRGEIDEVGDNGWLIFHRAPVLGVTLAQRCRSSVCEDDLCGDSLGTVSDCGRVFAYISDGMGSGREAAATSGVCSAFLKKLLPICELTNDFAMATIGALNSFLCSRNTSSGRECAATVDLAALDTVLCRAVFYKCGAAPTYVFRDGSLFKVHSRTMPIGIVSEPDIGRVSMELLPGDVIVMVSDGVTQGNEECPELFKLLSTRILTHNADQLADEVMRYADGQGAVDDVSVIVIKISEADELFLPRGA